MREAVEIDRSVALLRANLSKTARVSEWADLMGYNCPKQFARKFLRYYETRPQKILESVRIESITMQLRDGRWSNFEIARAHSISDEIALNKFINYHLGCSPTEVKQLSLNELEEVMRVVEIEVSNGVCVAGKGNILKLA